MGSLAGQRRIRIFAILIQGKEAAMSARPALALGFVFSLAAVGACGIREHNIQPKASAWPATDPGADQPQPGAGGESGSGGDRGGASSSGGRAGSGAGGATGGAPGSRGSGGQRGRDAGRGGETGQAGQSGQMDAESPPPPNTDPDPSEPGIDLGGTHVPRSRAIAIIHFGHSNMLGHAVDPTDLRPYFFTPQPQLWSYRGAGRFVPAKEPTANPQGFNEAGPGMALLRAASMHAPANYHFISIGLGVGSATTQDWSKGGLYYDDFVARVRELSGKVTFGAAVIMLGITDRHLPANLQGGFADRLTKIVSDLRADLGEPDLPILHTDYEVEASGELAVDGPVGRLFRPQIQMLPARVPRLAIVPTDMTGMEDDHHFNLAGQKLFGDRAIQILIDKGWASWPVP
jgi:hypothetical protein